MYYIHVRYVMYMLYICIIHVIYTIHIYIDPIYYVYVMFILNKILASKLTHQILYIYEYSTWSFYRLGPTSTETA